MLGRGQVDLKMTYGKVLTLKEVQHVLEVRRNLVSASSLVQQGHKVVITKNNVFIGKCYVCAWKKISVDLKLLKTHGNARKTS